jgi:phenylalanine ammonia-lyase
VVEGHYDARRCLSPATARVYEATRNVIGKPVVGSRPLIWNDNEQSLEPLAERLLADLRHRGLIVASLRK